MNYFKFKDTTVSEVVNKQERLFATKKMSPVSLSVAEIKERLAALKANKSEFKKLILNFDQLSNVEKVNLLSKFYEQQFLGLKYYLIDEYKKEFPQEKIIPSKLTYASKDNPSEIAKCNVKILAKKSVRFNPLKVYSKEDLEQLIADKKIIVVGYDVVKKVKEAGESVEQFVATYCPEFDEISVEEIAKFPLVMEELLKDVSVEELKIDYETIYMPLYKSGLKFLEGCAKASKEIESQKRKQLHKEMSQSNDRTKEFEDIEKSLADTAKGR